MMWARRAAVAVATILTFGTAHATEPQTCSLLIDANTGATIYEAGVSCDTRFPPASTFKLPLALMGFENGLLTSADSPALPYDPAIDAPLEVWRHTTTPRRWLRYSVIWYSWWLTGETGAEAFQAFVDKIDYGNRDLSGAPGKNNGLTHAWLGTSLKISPKEQAEFLHRVHARSFDLTDDTYDLLDQTISRFTVAGWPDSVAGKTGTTWATDDAGHRTRTQFGWFIGWGEHQGRNLIFVRLQVENDPPKGHAGGRARDYVLKYLPDWLSHVP
ncbi:MAG: penicillin-binding transpeptidase domain-containing protein [Paracoccaceae bacterium]